MGFHVIFELYFSCTYALFEFLQCVCANYMINSTIYKNKSVLGEEIGTYEKF